jgi:hypothetical protein
MPCKQVGIDDGWIVDHKLLSFCRTDMHACMYAQLDRKIRTSRLPSVIASKYASSDASEAAGEDRMVVLLADLCSWNLASYHRHGEH